MEVTYCTPDGESTAPSWSEQQVDMDQQMLIDIEQNIANLERMVGRRGSLQSSSAPTIRTTRPALQRGGSLSAPEKSPAFERKRYVLTSWINLIFNYLTQ